MELGAVIAISAIVTAACGSGHVTADCVHAQPRPDGSYLLADERRCSTSSPHSAYVYRYGGDRHGTVLRGGTAVRPKDSRIVTRSGTVIQRGGFGGTGRGGGG